MKEMRVRVNCVNVVFVCITPASRAILASTHPLSLLNVLTLTTKLILFKIILSHFFTQWRNMLRNTSVAGGF